MWGIGHKQSLLDLFVRHANLIQNFLRGISKCELVHKIAPYPEAAAQVVVSLHNENLEPFLRHRLRGHQPAGTSPDNDHIALDILLKLLGETGDDRPRDAGPRP